MPGGGAAEEGTNTAAALASLLAERVDLLERVDQLERGLEDLLERVDQLERARGPARTEDLIGSAEHPACR